MKQCRICFEHKPRMEMKKRKTSKDGLTTLCLACNREQEYQRIHGYPRPERLNIYKEIDGVKFKRCYRCSEYKTYDNFNKCQMVPSNTLHNCIPCSREVKKEIRESDPERARRYNRESAKKNYKKARVRCLAYSRSEKGKRTRQAYKEKNNDRIMRNAKEKSKQRVIDLADHYVRSTMASRSIIKGSEFPPEFVDAYRELMKLNRAIKEN